MGMQLKYRFQLHSIPSTSVTQGKVPIIEYDDPSSTGEDDNVDMAWADFQAR